MDCHAEQAQQKLICQAIFDRHKGMETTLNNKRVIINEESKKQLFYIDEHEVKLFLELFIKLADGKFAEPTVLPFPEVVVKQNVMPRFMLFHIDECQVCKVALKQHC